MRLKFLKFGYFIILFLIISRLFYWQVLKYDDLSAKAEQQHLSSHIIEGERGSVLFSDGSSLASIRPAYLLYGLPKVIQNKSDTALKLAQKIISDPSETISLKNNIYEKINQSLDWVAIEKDLTLGTKDEIESLSIKGLAFDPGSVRFYPESSTAAHLLGFVGSDSVGRQTGYFGLEGFYNGQLKGVRGSITEEKDARGLPLLFGTFLKQASQTGNSLILNVDRSIQYIVENELKNGVEKYGAKGGSVVVMEPKSGAILAMASFPNYDPGNFSKYPKEYFKNPAVAESFEPGSIFKVITMSAAVNENLVKPDTKCDDCSGPVDISGYLIRTWNNKYQPKLTMTETIVQSDNIGMVFVAKALGIDKMFKYIEEFGFGNTTGIDLQDEASPQIRSKNDWKEIDLATSSFGQGVAVTEIQMVRAVAAIANGGNLMEPHVVKIIKNGDKLIEIKPKIIRKPINIQTARAITQMMVEAVEKGEARVFAPKGYKVAGKTGTAQIPLAGHYMADKTVASFVGFAPADDPKFVMLVKYNEPSSSIFGAETAAPTFFEIAKRLLFYFNVAPN